MFPRGEPGRFEKAFEDARLNGRWTGLPPVVHPAGQVFFGFDIDPEIRTVEAPDACDLPGLMRVSIAVKNHRADELPSGLSGEISRETPPCR